MDPDRIRDVISIAVGTGVTAMIVGPATLFNVVIYVVKIDVTIFAAASALMGSLWVIDKGMKSIDTTV